MRGEGEVERIGNPPSPALRRRIGTDGGFWGLDNGTDGGFGGLDNGTDGGFRGLDNGTVGGLAGLDNGTDGRFDAVPD
jgi:hypothetical protein